MAKAFRWSGITAMHKQTAVVEKNYNRNLRGATRDQLEDILQRAIELAPMSPPNKSTLYPGRPPAGALRDSGRITTRRKGKTMSGSVIFGSPTVPYAAAVHEHLSTHSPPTWLAKINIDWTQPGTGPKFLEKAFRGKKRTMADDIAKSLHLQTGMITQLVKRTVGVARRHSDDNE